MHHHWQSTGRRRAIRAALGRLGLHGLGLHVGNHRIIEELASQGISAGEDQIKMVRIDMLQTPDLIRGRLSGIPRHNRQQVPRLPRRHARSR